MSNVLLGLIGLFIVGLGVGLFNYLGTACYMLSKEEKIVFESDRQLGIIFGVFLMIIPSLCLILGIE